MILQPVDWHEHDVYGTYAIDVFGRRPDKKVVCVRLTGFRPYFFASEKPDVFAVYEAANKKWVSKFGPNKGKEDYAFKMSKNGRIESDRRIPDLKPKHLYSGKRGNGKTDWR